MSCAIPRWFTALPASGRLSVKKLSGKLLPISNNTVCFRSRAFPESAKQLYNLDLWSNNRVAGLTRAAKVLTQRLIHDRSDPVSGPPVAADIGRDAKPLSAGEGIRRCGIRGKRCGSRL